MSEMSEQLEYARDALKQKMDECREWEQMAWWLAWQAFYGWEAYNGSVTRPKEWIEQAREAVRNDSFNKEVEDEG